ncbi:MAG: tripartite tricarboxylate transporter TctB family protein [Rhodospirillum sp.]|nr:tripartite tricarboxylate transporter TctB family protein [Rhodospirillum sp.]MCF8490500.1 tripartite tricarboxylate transporter TctB family protein [Rhodospirillum sp.]MCF8500643.1 tripartite tricarboxylate transporter TctB family protein [Rhodospirillum sp.]
MSELTRTVVGRPERLLVHALVALGGAVILWETASLSSDSATFPGAVGLGLILFSVISAIATLRSVSAPTVEAPLVQGMIGLALLGAYVGSTVLAGFLTSALWFLPAMALVGGERRRSWLVAASAGFVLLAFVVFRLVFAQPFPPELILGEI